MQTFILDGFAKNIYKKTTTNAYKCTIVGCELCSIVKKENELNCNIEIKIHF